MVSRPPDEAGSCRSGRGAGRGQAHTLEAVVAGMLLLASVVFALQVTAVTPLTGSTSSQHIENQQASLAEGMLSAESENGTLSPTLRYWSPNESRFHGSTDRGYVAGGPPTVFGGVLNRTFSQEGIAFNVQLSYLRTTGDRQTVRLVYLGDPSEHASVASHLVTLYDDDPLLNADGTASGDTLSETEFFARDAAPDSRLYNVIEVEVILWRM
jgi:hypothetical protein